MNRIAYIRPSCLFLQLEMDAIDIQIEKPEKFD